MLYTEKLETAVSKLRKSYRIFVDLHREIMVFRNIRIRMYVYSLNAQL